MKLKFRFKKAGLVVVPAVFTMAITTSTAWANQWNGLLNPNTGTAQQGIAASIWCPSVPDYYNSGVPYGNFTTNWVLVANASNPNYNLAQVGWENQPNNGSTRLYFYGWIVNNQYYETRLGYGPRNDEWDNYQVANENGNWVGRANGVEIGHSAANFSATRFHFSEEILNEPAPFIGSSNDASIFQKMEYYTGSYWAPMGYLQQDTTDANGIVDNQFKSNDINSYFGAYDIRN